jgi:EAL domain-containing protein (putative c-di-GMP-specific phosphodiesterase class I)
MTTQTLNLDQSLLEIGNLLETQIGTVKYMAGSRIFEQSEPGDCAYMIDSGHVEVSSVDQGEKNFLAMLGPGEIFGEMALLDGQPRSATATALHETVVIPISRKHLLDAVNRGSPIVRLVLIASINRLRTVQTKVSRSDEEKEIRIDPLYEEARVNAAEQVRLRMSLENAISNQEFKLAYQPIVDLSDGRTAGFEALIRWPQPGNRFTTPLEFIPLAEETGMIVPLGMWVLETGLQALASIGRNQGVRETNPAFMSINVSPRQLDTEENVEQLATMIERADIDPTNLKLEITEQTLLNDPNMAMIGLSRLRSTGASIAIDDFGTGYSSLNYLHRFPLDTLKVDRTFIQKLVGDPSAQCVVAAIVGLARDLGMDVVAEGIEETEELRWLQANGCRYGQGYLMAKPMRFEDALGCLTRSFEW